MRRAALILTLAAATGCAPAGEPATAADSGGPVAIQPGFRERLADDDGDGLADELVLTVTVEVREPGAYQVSAGLDDSERMRVGAAGGPVSLAAGRQTIELVFAGSTIFAFRHSGPYRLVQLSIADPSAAVVAFAADMGATRDYDYRQFEP